MDRGDGVYASPMEKLELSARAGSLGESVCLARHNYPTSRSQSVTNVTTTERFLTLCPWRGPTVLVVGEPYCALAHGRASL